MLSKKQLKKLNPGSLKIKTDENGRLTSDAEILLQNLLISADLDFALVQNITGLDITKVIWIYTKYSQYIDKMVNNRTNADKDDEAIEKCLKLLIGHIDAIIEAQEKAGTTAMKGTDLANICKILDRLTSIKQAKVAEFDKIAAGLIVTTVKVKTLEKIEYGELQLDTDASYNFNTLADKLQSRLDHMNGTGHNQSKARPVYLFNVKEATWIRCNTIEEARVRLEIPSWSSVKYRIDKDEEYNGYKIYSEEKFKELSNGDIQ